MKLTWQDSEDIGIELFEKFTSIAPLTVRFTDLHKMVLELSNFDDNSANSNEGILEQIQMAWYEEWQEEN
jgi:FeS assembly protein IscX